MMKRYVFGWEIDLPGGNHIVVTAEIPDTAIDTIDKFGAPKRNYWTSYKLFKRKINADKYKARIAQKQKSDHYNEVMISKGIFSMN